MKEIIIEVPDEFGKTLKPWKANAEIKSELIRCKDCKHRYNGCCYIRTPERRINFTVAVPDDWFCADGERKDDDTQ